MAQTLKGRILLSGIYVALGGAIGSVLRYFAGNFLEKINFTSFHSLLFINMLGSFIILFLPSLFAERLFFSENMKAFWLTGFCGGFTTFSSFSAQNFALLQKGAYTTAFFQISLSIVLCLFMSLLGFILGQKLGKWVIF